MKINEVEEPLITVRRSQYPTDNKPEFLLIGRSNVGKSSFINSIVERRNIARISSKPGKTQTINFYFVNKDFYLVDVPGYGYTSTGKQDQKKFGMMIEEYLSERKELKEVFMLIDFRHKPTEDDLLMYNFLKFHEVKVTLVATKVDKIGSSQRKKYVKQITDNLDLALGDELVLFSSKTKLGKKEIQAKIESEVYKDNTL
ncbi:MAG: ribosome biogenesis GTP-binding protein YihA/YsxC [Tenericutes bacterium]|nr:ribosome biogenesis GTP-binding protein YihA/YsxC [Mycoplasmatota bacterium]